MSWNIGFDPLFNSRSKAENITSIQWLINENSVWRILRGNSSIVHQHGVLVGRRWNIATLHGTISLVCQSDIDQIIIIVQYLDVQGSLAGLAGVYGEGGGLSLDDTITLDAWTEDFDLVGVVVGLGKDLGDEGGFWNVFVIAEDVDGIFTGSCWIVGNIC